MDFCSMKRKELQALCKKNGVPANLSNVEMATRLAAVQKVKQQKMFKSCLKNLEIVVTSDDENDKDKIRGKRVRFSPENETFEFEKTDPRELRLLARKKRAMEKSEKEKNPVLVADNLNSVEDSVDSLVAVCEDGDGIVEQPVGRNLRRRSRVNSNVGFVPKDVNVVKQVEKGNIGRNLRSCGSKREQKDVEAAMMSPVVEKKAKRGRKGDGIVEERVVDTVDKPSDKMADNVGNTHMFTRRSLRRRGIAAENSGKTDDGAAGALESNNLTEKDLNEKGETVLQVPRRSVRRIEKANNTDLTSISKGQLDCKSSKHEAAKNHVDGCIEMAVDCRKRKRVGKKAAIGKNKEFVEVSHGAVAQQNGNMEKKLDNAFGGKRLRGRKMAIEGLGKGDVGDVKVLGGEYLMRESLQRTNKKDEKDGSSISSLAVRRSTRQTGKVKVDGSLSKQAADDDVPQRADQMCPSDTDNQRARLVNEASEARVNIVEKADAGMTDGSSNEETIPGSAVSDDSIAEMNNKKVDDVAAANNFQGEIISTPVSISTRKFSISFSEENGLDASEPVCHSMAKPTTPESGKVCGADCELPTCSVTDFGDNKMGSEKFTCNERDRSFNHSRNEELLKKKNGLEESPVVDEGSENEEAIKNEKQDRAAAIVGKLDDQLMELEEAAGSRETCKSVSGENEGSTLRVSDFHGLNQVVSEEKVGVGYEANLDASAQHPIVDGSTVSAEASLATVIELMEEDEDTKTAALLHNQEAGTSSRCTDKTKMEDNKDGNGDVLGSISNVNTSLYLQSQVDGELTVLGLSKKKEQRFEEKLRDLASVENSSRRDYSAEDDKFTAAKKLEVAEDSTGPKLFCVVFEDNASNSYENKELESEKATMGSNKDVESVENELSECVFEKINIFHNVPENQRKEVEAAFIRATGCDGFYYGPSSVRETDYERVKVNYEIEQAEAKDIVYPAALEPQSFGSHENTDQRKVMETAFIRATCSEGVIDEIAEPIGDASELRCLSLLDDYIGTNEVIVATKENEHGEVSTSEDACITKSNDLAIERPENLQSSSCVVAEVPDALIDTGMSNSEETEFAGEQGDSRRGWENVNEELLGSHVQNMNEYAALVANDHLPSEMLKDLQSSPCRVVGMHFATGHIERGENESLAGDDDVEDLQRGESMPVEADHDDKGNELGCMVEKLDALPCTSACADETTLKASTNDKDVTPAEDIGGEKLFEATSIRKMEYHVLGSSPSAIINGERDYEYVEISCDAAKAKAKDIVCPAMVEPQTSDRNGKAINIIEGTVHGTSELGCAALLDSSLETRKYDVAPEESEHGGVKISEDSCMTISDDLAYRRQEELRSLSYGTTEVSNVVIDHGKMNNSEEVLEAIGRIDKYVEGNYEADQAEAHDVVCHSVIDPQSLDRSKKAIDKIEGAFPDASEVGCVPFLDDSLGTSKDIISPRESELEVKISEHACVTRTDDLASETERQKDRWSSCCGMTEVSDVIVDHGNMNNTEVEASEDEGNSRIGQKNMNRRQLDGHLQADASANASDHTAMKRPDHPQSSPSECDGIHLGQHSDYEETSCLANIEELKLRESVSVKDHHDAEGGQLNSILEKVYEVPYKSATFDEKTSAILMNNIQDTTENSSQNKLVEAASTREIGCRSLSTSPFSIVYSEVKNEVDEANCDADQAETKKIVNPAIIEPSCSGDEKETDEIKGVLQETSAFRALLIDDSAGMSEPDVVQMESDYGEVDYSGGAGMIRTDDLASERREDLQSSCDIVEVSCVIDHGKSNNSEAETREQGHNMVSVEIAVDILPSVSSIIISRNSERVTDMHDNPERANIHKLFDVTGIHEVVQEARSNNQCSMPKKESSSESFKENSEPATEMLEDHTTSVSMHNHPLFDMPDNEEGLIDILADKCLNIVDHSVEESYYVVNSKDVEHDTAVNPVDIDEPCHIASGVKYLGSQNILGSRDNNNDISSKASAFSPSPCAFDICQGFEAFNPADIDEPCHIASRVEYLSSQSILGSSDSNNDISSKASAFSPSPCAFDICQGFKAVNPADIDELCHFASGVEYLGSQSYSRE